MIPLLLQLSASQLPHHFTGREALSQIGDAGSAPFLDLLALEVLEALHLLLLDALLSRLALRLLSSLALASVISLTHRVFQDTRMSHHLPTTLLLQQCPQAKP